VTYPDPANTCRSPFPLLDGRILCSFAPGDPAAAAAPDWDVVALDPRAGQRTTVLGGPAAQVEAVLVLRYPARKMYLNRRQLVFGGRQDPADPGHATVHFPDAPMLATLLTSDLRRGRPVAALRGAGALAVYDAGGPLLGTAPLHADGSARIRVPSRTPVLLGLLRGGAPLLRMTEEHQFGPGETISLGVAEKLFDNVCGGCHGSVSGRELDVAVVPDALTGASLSLSADAPPRPVGS
jgi:hypothetical protein